VEKDRATPVEPGALVVAGMVLLAVMAAAQLSGTAAVPGQLPPAGRVEQVAQEQTD
jgi:hypothetical protein